MFLTPGLDVCEHPIARVTKDSDLNPHNSYPRPEERTHQEPYLVLDVVGEIKCLDTPIVGDELEPQLLANALRRNTLFLHSCFSIWAPCLNSETQGISDTASEGGPRSTGRGRSGHGEGAC